MILLTSSKIKIKAKGIKWDKEGHLTRHNRHWISESPGHAPQQPDVQNTVWGIGENTPKIHWETLTGHMEGHRLNSKTVSSGPP